ncbi:MAG: class I SAM-dependent methyltransferase, partial [bacterium]
MKTTGFYELLATDYAVLTNEATRRPAATRFVTALRQRYPHARSVLDVATGTGLFALAAAAAGFPVVAGLDPAAELLAQARQASHLAGLNIRWLAGRMEMLEESTTELFDLLLCMGNSLPHLTAPGDLDRAAAGFRACLNPGGTLFLHLLNYPRLLAAGERIIGITRDGLREFIRFQDPPDHHGLIR